MKWEMSLIGNAHCVEVQILSRSGQMQTITFSAMRAGRGGNDEEIHGNYGYRNLKYRNWLLSLDTSNTRAV